MGRFPLWPLLLTGVTFAATACTTVQPLELDAVQSAAAFDGRSLADPGLREYLRAEGIATQRWPLRTWNIEQLAGAARYFQPDLAELRSAASAAEAAFLTAGEHPNPTLSVKPGYNSSSHGISPWIMEPALDFTIETAGKRGHRQAAAAAHLRTARLNVETAAWKARSDVRKALLAMAGAAAAKEELNRQETVQTEAVKLLESQVAAGGASPQDAAAMRIPLQQTKLVLHDAEITLAKGRAQLAAAIGVPVSALNGIEFDHAKLVRLPAAPPGAKARRAALTSRTEVLTALASYAAAEEKLRLEAAKQYPDIHLGPGYKLDQNSNKWTIGFGMELPVFNQHRGAIAEAEAARRQAADHFIAVQARVAGEIDLALSVYRAAVQKADAAGRLAEEAGMLAQSVARQEDAGEVSQVEVSQRRIELGAAVIARIQARQQSLEASGELEDALQTPSSQWQ